MPPLPHPRALWHSDPLQGDARRRQQNPMLTDTKRHPQQRMPRRGQACQACVCAPPKCGTPPSAPSCASSAGDTRELVVSGLPRGLESTPGRYQSRPCRPRALLMRFRSERASALAAAWQPSPPCPPCAPCPPCPPCPRQANAAAPCPPCAPIALQRTLALQVATYYLLITNTYTNTTINTDLLPRARAPAPRRVLKARGAAPVRARFALQAPLLSPRSPHACMRKWCVRAPCGLTLEPHGTPQLTCPPRALRPSTAPRLCTV